MPDDRQGGARRLFGRRHTAATGRRLILAALALAILTAAATRGLWTARLGGSLVCTGEVTPSDMILVENFDPSFEVFQRAAALRAAGLAPRALVPVPASADLGVVDPVSREIAEVMARHAGLGPWEILPIRVVEPITLNVATRLRDHLARNSVRSLILVTPGFRSRRSDLAYRAMLEPGGTRVHCVPVFDGQTPATWTGTWHGIEDVGSEFLKLQYYRFYVLPLLARTSHAAQVPGPVSKLAA